MRTDGSLGACACGREAAYVSTQECAPCYKRRMRQRPKPLCSICSMYRAEFISEGVCRWCRTKRIAGYGSEVCKAPDCTEPLYVKAPLKGWCRQHWVESLQATVTASERLSEPLVWRSSKFDVKKYQRLLQLAKEAWLEDNEYMIQVAEASAKHKREVKA